MENFDKLKEILVDVLGVSEDDVKLESKFVRYEMYEGSRKAKKN